MRALVAAVTNVILGVILALFIRGAVVDLHGSAGPLVTVLILLSMIAVVVYTAPVRAK